MNNDSIKALSIIIPYNGEGLEIISPLLSSINCQCGIQKNSIEILICDNSETHQPLNLSSFVNIIDYIKIFNIDPTFGPGQARQYGIDNSIGNYIMFCDCDDVLYCSFTLMSVLSTINNSVDQIDEYIFNEFWENIDGNRREYSSHNDTVHVHGNIYRRYFLIENNIRFADDIRYSEDVYFTSLVTTLAKRIKKINEIIYVWKCSPTSVTRAKDNEFWVKNVSEGIYSTYKSFYVLKNIYNKINNDLLHTLICFYIIKFMINSVSNGEFIKLATKTINEFTNVNNILLFAQSTVFNQDIKYIEEFCKLYLT